MTPKWQKVGSLAQEMCTLLFLVIGAVFASKGYPFKTYLVTFIPKENEYFCFY